MLFYNVRKNIIKKVVQLYKYQKVLFFAGLIKPKKKAIYVDVTEIALNRYLYVFLKFFHLSGYTVYLPNDKFVINEIARNKTDIYLLSEARIVKFGYPKTNNCLIHINKNQINNDYYSSLFDNSFLENTYHIPMCEYHIIYQKDYWKEEFLIESKRKRSVFMIGNINREHYDNIAKEKVFNILSRRAIADFIFKQDYFIDINSKNDLEKYIESKIDKKVILIDTSVNFTIGGDKLKRILKGFDFYLAMPGIIIPQSHNIIEAMSVGSIPILHKTYANLFRPSLQNKINSLIYETFEELDALINQMFDLPEETIFILRKNVTEYYLQNLTPEAVVSQIENNNYSKIFLQAERISLLQLK